MNIFLDYGPRDWQPPLRHGSRAPAGLEALRRRRPVTPHVLTICRRPGRTSIAGRAALREGTDPAMAFVSNNLAVLSYAAGFTLWTYATVEDSVGAVLADGYFDAARTYLRADDLILLNALGGARILRVVANDGVRVRAVAIAGDAPIGPPEIPSEAILDEAGWPILDESGSPILRG